MSTQSLSRSLAQFSGLFTPAVRDISSPEFPHTLITLLKNLIAFNNTVVLLYTNNHPPQILHNDVPPADQESGIDMFQRGAYLLDPYYRAAVDTNARGFYRLSDLAPDDFEATEYYRNYYRFTSISDECGYLISLGEDSFLNISLGYSGGSAVINSYDIKQLRDIAPLIEALVQQHWHHLGEMPPPLALNQQLETALRFFGTEFLTERETQVVQLFLHGHSTKSIAEKLCISPETVKLHRKNSYAKLDVCSQAELFHLFIGSLSALGSYSGGDPLVGYIN